jgi:peptidoglycan biosynthesis protein MviN/MurJ (putative lipid II flippase)
MSTKGGAVLIVLALGYAVNAVASLDAVTLEAAGRPDLPAKAMLAWAAVAVGSVVAFAPALGSRIVAYAVAGWLAGVGVTNVVMVRRVVLTRLRGENGTFPVLGLIGSSGIAAVAAWFVRPFVENLLTALLAFLVVGGTFAVVGLFSILSESDRGLVGANLRRFLPAFGMSPRGAASPHTPVQP